MRRILYVTGTRADFGLMRATLQQIQASSSLELRVLVTGVHLDAYYGDTVREIEESGLRIVAHVPIPLLRGENGDMARAIGYELLGVVEVLERERPDIVLLLGDRGEMLAAALASLHLNIAVAHIHGGELSGTVDEPVRHAISKLSHYHFTATERARERLIRMGESESNIFVTGAPGLDQIAGTRKADRANLFQQNGFNPEMPLAMVLFHPVLQSALEAGQQTESLMRSIVEDLKYQVLVLLPNSDTGSDRIRTVLEKFASKRCKLLTHLPREEYLAWMTVADVLVGNSSSGIIEAASLGLPVVNVGDRQNCRERNSNVVDVRPEQPDITQGIRLAGSMPRSFKNIYGDGHAGERIVDLLENLPLTTDLMNKCNAY